MFKRGRRQFLKQGTAFGLSSIATPFLSHPALASVGINDASGLNWTPLHHIENIAADQKEKAIIALRNVLYNAQKADVPFLTAGALHSMGGQAIPKNGDLALFKNGWINIDQAAQTASVSGGMCWNRIIPILDKLGLSPKIMQSNNDFSVGGTLSANAHGWAVPWGQFTNSIKSFNLMMASGNVIYCSRNKNAHLFHAAIGGYGLMGIIVDVEIELVPNQKLVARFDEIPSADIGPYFVKEIHNNPNINMAYGRVDISLSRGFEQAMLISYHLDDDQQNLKPVTGAGLIDKATKPILRKQVGSEPMKKMRWFLETDIQPFLSTAPTTRNSLLNVPYAVLADKNPKRSDILHEYFIPPTQLGEFLKSAHQIIRASKQQLLNITLRYVVEDHETLLSYAAGERIAAVMLFSQKKTQKAEEDMAAITRTMISKALELGGSYYPTYRLHATEDQFAQAFPKAHEFAALKRMYDPSQRFSNALWKTYLEQI